MKIISEEEYTSEDGIKLNIIHLEDGTVLVNWLNPSNQRGKESATMVKTYENDYSKGNALSNQIRKI